MDEGSGTPALGATGARAPRPFLRRGEGVEKRVFASRYRKPASSGTSGGGRGSSVGDSGADAAEDVVSRRGDQHGRRGMSVEASASNQQPWQDKPQELASDTQLLSVGQPQDQRFGGSHTSSRFLRNSINAAWDTKQAEEELELEEFRALETQIKADVVGSGRQRPEQAAQAQSASATLPPSGPNGGRSYANIHQGRPPQPPRAAGRSSSDRPSASATPLQRPAAAGMGWSPSQSQQQQQQQQYGDAFGFDGADEGLTGGFDDADEPELGLDDAWIRQHSFFGKTPASGAAQDGGGNAGSRGSASGGGGGGGSGGGGFGSVSAEAAAWGPDSCRPAATASGRDSSGTHGSLRGTASKPAAAAFDDGDAWNDTSSFYGGASAGRRKGAGPAVGGGTVGKPRGGDTFAPAATPLEDPWAAPAGGEEAYGVDADTFVDEGNGWGLEEEQYQQQQQLQQQRQGQSGTRDEERGPDQPFVRALFGKQGQQQQQQRGGGGARAAPGKAAGGPAGKGKAAEPAGPSAAEVERLQALEEQVANVSSERAALVRMRTELEKAANRLEQERQAWEKSRAEEQARWEAQRDAEEARLRRDRRVLEKQSKALLKMPNKKERSAMEAAEAALEAERREGRAREARHKLTVERLRRQLVELQERNHELREEVRWHEAQQLERGNWPPQGGGARTGPGSGQQQQPPVKARPPSRSTACQTDALPFLPPLENGGPAEAPVGRSCTMRSGEAPAGAGAAGARPKSSGSNIPQTAANNIAGGSRLRPMQAGRPATTPHASKPQQQPQSAFRGARTTGPRGFGAGAGAGAAGAQAYGGAPSRWREGDDEEDLLGEDAEVEEEEEEEETALNAFSARHQTRRPPPQQQRGPQAASGSWWPGDEQGAGLEEYGEAANEGEALEDEEDGDENSASAGHLRAGGGKGGGGGSGRVGYGGLRGGVGVEGVGAMDSPSAHSYMQNDDVEVLTDEGGGDGLDSDSLSALAWQQHQEFMARVGMAQGGRPAAVGAATGGGPGQRQSLQQRQQQGDAGCDASGRPQQQQPHPQQNVQRWQQQQPSAGAGMHPGLPGRGGMGQQQPSQPQAQSSQTQQRQHQQSGFFGTRSSGGGGQNATQIAFFGGNASSTQQPRSANEAHPSSSGPRPNAAAASGQRHATVDASVDLDGVSQTLAALRMGRQVEAAAAAVAANSHDTGPMGGAGSTARNGMAGYAPTSMPGAHAGRQQEGRPMGHMAGLQDSWSPVGGAGSGSTLFPSASGRDPSQAPGMWGPVPHGPGGVGAGQAGSAFQQQQPLLNQQHGRPPSAGPQMQQHSGRLGAAAGQGGSGGVMAGTAAGAAAVAQAVAGQQVRGAPSMPQTAVAGGGGDVLVREVRHADGKVERMYTSGRRLVLFANGTRKVALPDGSSRVYFINGDIKWTIPAAAAGGGSSPSQPPPGIGVVHYYYAEVSTWHSTYGGEGGVEVFYFPSGQTEAHHPGHGKEIVFPDGVLRVVTAEGTEMDVSWEQLSWAVQQPQPQVEGLGDDDI
ncbi:hypothetical protein Agub_g4541 [Astrephomene gubernaculifera]|uniref:Centromere protein J C-terminal domain-containing protein n=1 Tax=Astrephomene gubernaculifera TaxID=47775 RepID=A0AAD3HJY8_9CHLO|nr:hypothetical protein Agub_g4541 [Astrephomene gubernaculifera]